MIVSIYVTPPVKDKECWQGPIMENNHKENLIMAMYPTPKMKLCTGRKYQHISIDLRIATNTYGLSHT